MCLHPPTHTKHMHRHDKKKYIYIYIPAPLASRDAPPKVQKYVLKSLIDTLPTDAEQQKAFVSSGSLAYCQKLNQECSGKLQEQIEALNSIYPAEIVEYYTPGFVM